ncbi:MAG: tetratricopeptide repeat protein [Hyphomicrobiaceae bacterium]
MTTASMLGHAVIRLGSHLIGPVFAGAGLSARRLAKRGPTARVRTKALALALVLGLAVAAFASSIARLSANPLEAHPCFARDEGQRIEACSQLLAQPDLDPGTRSTAFAMRALSLSLMGRFEEAILDYDYAIEINPNYAVALNNRAWAKFRSGDFETAWPDVQRSLELDPWSPHAHDTRAHLSHVAGRAEDAYDDYTRAMQLGGQHMTRLYQCGLQAHGHYDGPLNGIVSEILLLGLKACTRDVKCDPLPPDEECREATS